LPTPLKTRTNVRAEAEIAFDDFSKKFCRPVEMAFGANAK